MRVGVMSWFKPKPGQPDALVQVLRDEIAYLRLQNDRYLQRNDRLTEALARKANIDLILPMPEPPPPQPSLHITNPWKDPAIATGNFTLPKENPV